MKLIATHDSATGESPTWWSAILTPFARTQSKTIKQQYEAGCYLFDIRVKKVFGVWRCAHGWWFTKKTAKEILEELNYLSCQSPIKLSVTITYEGKYNEEFLTFVKECKEEFYSLKYGPIAVKYGKDAKGLVVKYDIVEDAENNWCDAPSKQAFLPLDGKHWQTYIPIPWLWKQFYFKNVEFNGEYYQYVDFL